MSTPDRQPDEAPDQNPESTPTHLSDTATVAMDATTARRLKAMELEFEQDPGEARDDDPPPPPRRS